MAKYKKMNEEELKGTWLLIRATLELLQSAGTKENLSELNKQLNELNRFRQQLNDHELATIQEQLRNSRQ